MCTHAFGFLCYKITFADVSNMIAQIIDTKNNQIRNDLYDIHKNVQIYVYKKEQ